MKNLFLSIVLLIFLTSSYSLTFYPIEFYNSGWNNVGYTLEGGFPVSFDLYSCYFTSDTIINDLTYHKYYFDRTLYSQKDGAIKLNDIGVYIGAMRDNNNQYFFIPKDSLNERMIYDFNLGLNDTVPVGYYPNAAYKVIIDTNLVLLNDDSYRNEYSANLYNNSGNLIGYCKFIESIGNTYSLIHPSLFAVQEYNGGFENYSYCENGELLYVTPGLNWAPGNDCDFTISIFNKQAVSNDFITVIPNPVTNNIVTIKLNTITHQTILLKCFNIFGKLADIVKIDPHQGVSKINISNWQNGIYFAIIYADGNQVGECKFVVQ